MSRQIAKKTGINKQKQAKPNKTKQTNKKPINEQKKSGGKFSKKKQKKNKKIREEG